MKNGKCRGTKRREVARLFAVVLASRIHRQPSTNQPLPQSIQIEIHIRQTQQYRGSNMGGKQAHISCLL